MWVKKKDKVYKRHHTVHTKRFGTDSGGQRRKGTVRHGQRWIKIYKDRQTDRDIADRETQGRNGHRG
jgi:hypothetical protein